MFLRLFISDSFDRVQFRGLNRRINTEYEADADRHAEGESDGRRRDDGGPSSSCGDDARERKSKRNPDQPAENGDKNGLGKKLADDIGLPGANRAADADLARSF